MKCWDVFWICSEVSGYDSKCRYMLVNVVKCQNVVQLLYVWKCRDISINVWICREMLGCCPAMFGNVRIFL